MTSSQLSNGLDSPSTAMSEKRKTAFSLALATFAILVLELAMIRWLATQVRIAAYFANLVVLACFWGVASVFVFLGTIVGFLFDRLPPLDAYAADLGGSLAGVVAMAGIAALWAPPPAWIALGAVPLLWILRDRWSVAGAA